MQIIHGNGAVSHLSYCSNIHPGESWAEVRQNLVQYLPDIRQAMNPDGEFGIGLRLSAAAVADLADQNALTEFKTFLDDNQLYVFTINGFPYGPFHGTRVKEDVYLPDWQDAERLRYTNQLADVFAEFLPAGQVGSVSTVPGAFWSSINGVDDIWSMTRHMVEHAAHLVELERNTGKRIVLALEPEPCCFLETIEQSVAFFRDFLFSSESQSQLAGLLGVSPSQADLLLHRHLTLCLDLCHAAVEFESYDACIADLRGAGIGIGKLQISAGLRLESVTRDTIDLLKPFEDNVYLHQVVENCGGSLNRFADLAEAFAALDDDNAEREWRVHFHVPIFLDDLGDFSSTQFFVREALDKHRTDPVSTHLEVETYTWNVLPAQYRQQSIDAAIVRELQWVSDRLS
ncbi:MAG: metabolite traffic protein EboE [Granulosicoccus sp.]